MKYILLFAVIILAGCGTNGSSSRTAAADTTDTTATPLSATDTTGQIVSGCYAQISGRDSAMLQINQSRGVISGPLSYNYFEKDRNDGTFTGEMKGDTLRGWYLFKSEGVMSVRQVIWHKRDSSLVPAIGEMVQVRDTMRFAEPVRLNFDSSRAFVKVPCLM